MVNIEQQRSIASHGWYAEPDDHDSRFSRFVSADDRFPASILFPAGTSIFYDFNRPDDLAAEFQGCFYLVCQDVGLDLLAVDLATYVKQDMEEKERQKASANRFHGSRVFDVAHKISVQKRVDVGMAQIPAVRLQWDNQGEAYCFAGRPTRSSLWSIRRTFDDVDDHSFAMIVGSFGWLRPEFFASLPARFH